MPTITVVMRGADGEPLPEAYLNSLYAADLHFEPVRRRSTIQPDGSVALEIPGPHTALHARIKVPGFGAMWVMADGCGEGYSEADGPVDFVLEAARSQIHAATGLAVSSIEGIAHRDAAQEWLRLAEGPSPRPDAAMRALAQALWASEYAVVDQARATIASRPSRTDFLFGCNAFRYNGDTDYARRFQQVMNYATLPFYLKGLEPEEGKPLYERVDELLAWCETTGIKAKGHPLWWGHQAGIPQWLEGASWAEAQRHCARVVERSVRRYQGRIGIWDIINEAHDWANGLSLTHEQEVEITRISADTARATNPEATLIVNNCLVFGENAADGIVNNGPVYERVWTPLSYLQAVMDAGVSFDVIGLQLYSPARDMLSVSRLLDEYARFGKPLHVTELGVRSDREGAIDPEESEQVLRTRAEWHTPWTEMVQADWLDWFYTICYAREDLGAITWWDFEDPAFIESGAFLLEDSTPREMFFRLRALQAQWGVGPGGRA